MEWEEARASLEAWIAVREREEQPGTWSPGGPSSAAMRAALRRVEELERGGPCCVRTYDRAIAAEAEAKHAVASSLEYSIKFNEAQAEVRRLEGLISTLGYAGSTERFLAALETVRAESRRISAKSSRRIREREAR